MVRGRVCDFRDGAASASGVDAEGWVLQAPRVGGIVREKVVRPAWKRAAAVATCLVTPLEVVDAAGEDPERMESLAWRLRNVFGPSSVHVSEFYAMHAALQATFVKCVRDFVARAKKRVDVDGSVTSDERPAVLRTSPY